MLEFHKYCMYNNYYARGVVLSELIGGDDNMIPLDWQAVCKHLALGDPLLSK